MDLRCFWRPPMLWWLMLFYLGPPVEFPHSHGEMTTAGFLLSPDGGPFWSARGPDDLIIVSTAVVVGRCSRTALHSTALRCEWLSPGMSPGRAYLTRDPV